MTVPFYKYKTIAWSKCTHTQCKCFDGDWGTDMALGFLPESSDKTDDRIQTVQLPW